MSIGKVWAILFIWTTHLRKTISTQFQIDEVDYKIVSAHGHRSKK